MTNHPNRSRQTARIVDKLQSRQWLTWAEVSALQYYRECVLRFWPDDNPELYEYRSVMSLMDRRPIIEISNEKQ